jgi:hypothetical protein
LRPLARVLRMAGCREQLPVLEVRDALLDRTRLPRHHPLRRPSRYAVLLSPGAIVASDARRDELNREAVAAAGAGWLVADPDQLAAVRSVAGQSLRPVHRLPVAAVATRLPVGVPAVLYEPPLGYLGALVPECRRFHLDTPRVYAHHRDGTVTFSLPGSRRPTLLDIVPPRTERLAVGRCPRHGTAILAAGEPAGG